MSAERDQRNQEVAAVANRHDIDDETLLGFLRVSAAQGDHVANNLLRKALKMRALREDDRQDALLEALADNLVELHKGSRVSLRNYWSRADRYGQPYEALIAQRALDIIDMRQNQSVQRSRSIDGGMGL